MSTVSPPLRTPPSAPAEHAPQQRDTLRALLVEFATPDQILSAARRVRDAGYTHWDTHTPFPVHGMDEAMSIRVTRLPYIVLTAGIVGALTGLGLVWWTNATDVFAGSFIKEYVPNFVQGYAYLVSGKPTFSLPANIPVIFELTVLFASLAAVFGMLVMNNLPLHYNPLLVSERFRRATNDRFFLTVQANDPRFDPSQTRQLLHSLGGLAIEEVHERPQPRLPTRWIAGVGVIVGCILLIPPSIIAWARSSNKDQPRIHILHDMDHQEKYKTQRGFEDFADLRVMRPLEAGTIARGDLREDEHFYRGLTGAEYATTFPTHRQEVQLTYDFLERGKRQFIIYCAPCHGENGSGNGMVNQRAVELAEPGWVPAASLHDAERNSRATGHIFNTITNGIRTMPAYGDKLSAVDRWAVTAYVRALQRSYSPQPGDVTEELQRDMRARLPGGQGAPGGAAPAQREDRSQQTNDPPAQRDPGTAPR